jgi:endogenous inhibitor of DNA gyrase (YacG/DUF329 family)
MKGQSEREWPDYPFCSAKCRLIDLGRWLGEGYRIPTGHDDNESSASEDTASDSP